MTVTLPFDTVPPFLNSYLLIRFASCGLDPFTASRIFFLSSADGVVALVT